MKIGVANLLSSYDVVLPTEIIAAVLEHVCAHESTRLKTLFSCCLLSRDWYKAAITLLYEKPKLTNHNFDKFARTISPPVNAHIKRVGLENFVRHLDMGNLAYESTNSLTARLLRRTKMSLEVFVAPATSFSVSSLAPLSKCLNLHVLDLSRDFYDILLGQLLNSIRDLPIHSLSLPRSAVQRPFQLKPLSPNGHTWPKTLIHLTINDQLPSSLARWHELLASFPKSLTSLTFDQCLGWHSFWYFPHLEMYATNIKVVRVVLRREQGGFPVGLILKAFPSAWSISIPLPSFEFQYTTTDVSEELNCPKERGVQYLSFTLLPELAQPKLTTDFLYDCIKTFPQLRRIDIPEICLEVDDIESDKLDIFEEIMAKRTKEHEESGIFLT